MTEIKVTYETLFDLLRREKGRGELQDLEKDFYEDVMSYLTEKQNSLTISSSRGEREKIRIQIKNVKKILRELYELREKKIMNLASSKVKTSSNLIDTSKLLDKEQDLFNDACDLFSKYKKEILEKITIEHTTDDMMYSQNDTRPEEKPTPEPRKEPTLQNNPQQNNQNDVKEKQQSGMINITLLYDLPRFLGMDKKIYGPYRKGENTQMPHDTAKLLLDKKRAEQN